MSRHTIPSRNPDHTVTVGYDRPFNAFFIQVWEDDEIIYYEDCVEDLNMISEWADIPDGLIEQLTKEAMGEADTNTVKNWHNEYYN